MLRIAFFSSCSPLSIKENCSFSTSFSISASERATSACISASGSSSNSPANPCRSSSWLAIPSQVVTSSRSAPRRCICAWALRLSDQKSSATLAASNASISCFLLARSKTHHCFMDAPLQAFDLVTQVIHTGHCIMFFLGRLLTYVFDSAPLSLAPAWAMGRPPGWPRLSLRWPAQRLSPPGLSGAACALPDYRLHRRTCIKLAFWAYINSYIVHRLIL